MVAVVYKPNSLEIEAVCDGPGAYEHCPKCVPGMRVPCAGKDIILSPDPLADLPGRRKVRVRFLVPPGATFCPLAEEGASTRGPRPADNQGHAL